MSSVSSTLPNPGTDLSGEVSVVTGGGRGPAVERSTATRNEGLGSWPGGRASGRAVVVSREGASLRSDEVLASLSGRLARYKIPKTVVEVAALPRTASGELLKADLRRLYGSP